MVVHIMLKLIPCAVNQFSVKEVFHHKIQVGNGGFKKQVCFFFLKSLSDLSYARHCDFLR